MSVILFTSCQGKIAVCLVFPLSLNFMLIPRAREKDLWVNTAEVQSPAWISEEGIVCFLKQLCWFTRLMSSMDFLKRGLFVFETTLLVCRTDVQQYNASAIIYSI